MEQTSLSRQDILAQCFKTPRGHLADYIPVGFRAAELDGEFLAHAIAYDKRHGSVRDAQVGLPVATLATPAFPRLLLENSLAHLALLNPKDLLRAWQFAHGIPQQRFIAIPQDGRRTGASQARELAVHTDWLLSWRRHNRFEYMVHGYLLAREACWPWWERTALWFRQPLKTLYALSHTKACDEAAAILFDRMAPPGTLF